MNDCGIPRDWPSDDPRPCPECGATVFPIRVQLRRSKGWRMPPNTVKVDRTTPWGNPWRITVGTNLRTGKHVYFVDRGDFESVIRVSDTRPEAVAVAVALFRQWVNAPQQSTWRDRATLVLKGKNLACWCPDECHGNVLLEMVNQ